MPAMSDKPTFVRTTVVELGKFCMDASVSGWRTPSPTRIAVLKTEFSEGRFGQTVSCSVSVLPEADAQDQAVIDDGYSTVKALRDLRDDWDAGNFTPDPDLLKIFEHGLRVTVFTYTDNHNMRIRRAWKRGRRRAFLQAS